MESCWSGAGEQQLISGRKIFRKATTTGGTSEVGFPYARSLGRNQPTSLICIRHGTTILASGWYVGGKMIDDWAVARARLASVVYRLRMPSELLVAAPLP